MEPLRLALEDYYLDNETYKAGNKTSLKWTHGTPGTANAGMTALGWSPDGDQGRYDYAVTASTNSYAITVKDSNSKAWSRCEAKMSKCCSGSGTAPASCP